MRGFVRVSVGVPKVHVGDVQANVGQTLALLARASDEGSALVVFPELGLCGYTLRDLLLDGHLIERCWTGLSELVDASRDLRPLGIVGLVVSHRGGLYNVAAAFQGGTLLGIIPKSYLPNYREFEETRWFRPGTEVPDGSFIEFAGRPIPFGTDLLFEAATVSDFAISVELCEDYWVQLPPSAFAVGAGATVIANLSASNFTIGKAELRRLLARTSSDRGKCAYLYVAAGPGESSTDLAFDADAFVCENGEVLAESQRFLRSSQLVTADIDLESLVRERISTNTFGDCAQEHRLAKRAIAFEAGYCAGALRRDISAHPFLPNDPATLAQRCWETFEIQSNALATRSTAIGEPRLILGLSGGLDSTQAALVCAAALDLLERPRSDLIAVTMPGLGTTDGTRRNAIDLAAALGAELVEIDIKDPSHQILGAVDHRAAAGEIEATLQKLRDDPAAGDVAFENVQARLRTLILMTLANMKSGIVVGTGDLSEKALGWSTYAGDQIAMYDVNASVPKTLIRFIIRWVANEKAQQWRPEDPARLRDVLGAILDTPISPELLPASETGVIAQLTEDKIGPYELHDFFLYHFVRHGARPARILDLAGVAFRDRYDLPTLKRWMRVFLERFFHHQFKRSCTADAPKVGMVALSPRGDWRMPSDAEVRTWLEEVEGYSAP